MIIVIIMIILIRINFIQKMLLQTVKDTLFEDKNIRYFKSEIENRGGIEIRRSQIKDVKAALEK